MNIAAILRDQALAYGSRTAIRHGGRTATFEQLDLAASAAAEDLAAAGIQPGSTVLVFVPMSIELYATMIGLFRLRATAAFVDPSAGGARLAECIGRVRPDAFAGVPRAHVLRLTSPAIRAVRLKIAIGGRVPFAPTVAGRLADTSAAVPPCDPDTPAVITFTSGSTGQPKAAVRTHGFLVAQHRALAESLALQPGEIDLTTLPIFLLANLASGVTSVIPDADLRAPGEIVPGPVLQEIRTAGVTRTVASPAFLLRLAQDTSAAAHLGSLRRIYTGGAPVFPRTLDTIAAAAPGAQVVAVYGSTEAEPIAHVERSAISADDRTGMQNGAGLLAGTIEPSISLRIINDRWGMPLGPWRGEDLARESLPAGGTGEIVVSGAHVLGGYLEGRGDDETKIRVGGTVWHRTGDAGYLDARGRLWLLGRCSAKMHDVHGTVYPFSVECAASAIAGIRRTAFVQRGGRRVLAVELDAGLRQPDVQPELDGRLGWARIDEVRVVRRIPVDRRHNAKVDYPALEKQLR